jgi:hypothetical protein
MGIGKILKYCHRGPDFSGHKIAISLKPKSSPWGGGNQVVEQLIAYLEAKGHKVTFQLTPDITAILLVDPRPSETTMFSLEEIVEFKQAHPQVRCIHRINECDMRKGTHEVDEILHRANQVADYTIFISHWLRDYFMERWFEPHLPHRVIQNGADEKIFYPQLDKELPAGGMCRIVTHHWSDNWNKGFRIYEQVDRLIAQGELEGFALMVIGRWPAAIRWRAAVTHAPTRGKKLASLLRQNHLYLTGSVWEPCGMHHIEGAQCGLPLVYHEDGGGIVEFGQRYGVGFREDVKTALVEARRQYQSLREQVLALASSGLEMCREYETVLAP